MVNKQTKLMEGECPMNGDDLDQRDGNEEKMRDAIAMEKPVRISL